MARAYLHELMAEENELKEEQRNLEGVVTRMHEDKAVIIDTLESREQYYSGLQQAARQLEAELEERGLNICQLNETIESLRESIDIEERKAL